METIAESIENVQEELFSAKTGILTGFPELDAKTHGFHPAELTVIAARSSMGKSAFMLDLALNISKEHPVAIFSLEMCNRVLIERMIANIAQTNYFRLRKGDADETVVNSGIRVISGLDIFLCDRSFQTVAQVRDLLLETQVRVVFIDYLQLLNPGKSSGQRYLEVDGMCQQLRAMAKDLNISVVLLSQLNRAVEQREGHEPRLSDLRESGGIEQTADSVWFLHRPSYYNLTEFDVDSEDDGEAFIFIAKQRNGPVGKIRCLWISEFMGWRSIGSL